MNGVDRADQMRGTNACSQKEKRLELTLWHFLVDFATLNAYQVYLKLWSMKMIEVSEKESGDEEENEGNQNTAMSLREFKRQLAESLCSPYAEEYQAKKTPKSARMKTPVSARIPASAMRTRRPLEDGEETDDDDDDAMVAETPTTSSTLEKFQTALYHHVFTANPDKGGKKNGKHCGVCHLCRIMGDTTTSNPLTVYGCVQCQRCFHPECFLLYHNLYQIGDYNEHCKDIHDRLQEYFLVNKHMLDHNVEGEDTPTNAQKRRQ